MLEFIRVQRTGSTDATVIPIDQSNGLALSDNPAPVVDAGDEAATAGAQTVLDIVSTWPATVATDSGGLIDMWQDIADAARNGDVAGINDAGYSVICTDVVAGR